MMDSTAKANYILMSLVANDKEKRCAQKVVQGSATQEELRTLDFIHASVTDRERGRTLVMPSDPELAQSLLSGLESFVSSVRKELSRIERGVNRRRNRMISLSLTLSVSFVVLLLAVELGQSRSAFRETTGFYAPLIACTAIIALVSTQTFRSYQALDDTLRRLQEKFVALNFLEASIRLAASNHEVSPVLEQAWSMFLAHYETPQTPVGFEGVIPPIVSTLRSQVT